MDKTIKKNRGSDIKMDIEQATERCNQLIKAEHANWIGISNQIAIGTVLSELERLKKYENLEWQEFNELAVKDKIIDLMAKELSKLNYIQYCNANNCDYPPCNKEKCIKEYFTNKATDNVGE